MGLYQMFLEARRTGQGRAMQACPLTAPAMHVPTLAVAHTISPPMVIPKSDKRPAKTNTQREWRSETKGRDQRCTQGTANQPKPSLTIVGGYLLLRGSTLLASWWLMRRGTISFRDWRVYLGLHELLTRRKHSRRKSVPRFDEDELLLLLQLPRTHTSRAAVRRSIRVLTTAGMLSWSESALTLHDPSRWATPDHDIPVDLLGIGNSNRLIPIPRRLLRLMTSTRQPALAATVLGHCIRCIFNAGTRERGRGLVKASWIADLFGIHERTIKHARSQLVRLGILTLHATPQRVMNRWGIAACINLVTRTQTPPLTSKNAPVSPPPRETSTSSKKINNQHLAAPPRVAGARTRAKEINPHRTLSPHDLANPTHLTTRLRDDVATGRYPAGEANRLTYFAAAARACTSDARNPGGLFVWTLHHGLSCIRQRDEDLARRWIATLDNHEHMRPSTQRGPPTIVSACAQPLAPGLVSARQQPPAGFAHLGDVLGGLRLFVSQPAATPNERRDPRWRADD
jgi:hypothetical protein